MDLQDFEYYREVLASRSGLVIGPDKTYLLDSRLSPVAKKWGYSDIISMTKDLRQSNDEKLLIDIVEAMTTNETSFFRDIKPFQLMENIVLPYFQNERSKKSLRIWCSACSSGQEPYSLAMILSEMADVFGNWNIEIYATDISHQILNQAKKGIFTQFEVQRGLPVNYLMKYFEKVEEKWKIKDEIQKKVKFEYLNLLKPWPAMNTFDIVFCRNVLIYFNEETKKSVLERIADVMADDGYLFLGGAETVLGITEKFKLKEGQRGLYIKNSQATKSLDTPQNFVNRG